MSHHTLWKAPVEVRQPVLMARLRRGHCTDKSELPILVPGCGVPMKIRLCKSGGKLLEYVSRLASCYSPHITPTQPPLHLHTLTQLPILSI